MKKNYHKNAGAFRRKACPKSFRQLLVGSVLAASAFMPSLSHAQTNEVSYLHWINDTKNYSMTPATLGGVDEYLMAGTIFDNSGSGAYNQQLHYQRVDNGGNVIFSYSYDDYNHLYDERVVGNDLIDDNTSVITAMRRDPTGQTDCNIEVLRVDHGGKLISGKVIQSIMPPGDYNNMVPMGTLIVDNQLYICGYVAPNVNMGMFAGPRKAFVIDYDLATDAVVNGHTWDYTFSGGTTSIWDYDMAMRMTLTSNGYIYVTGGCNVVHPDPGTGGDQFVGGVMSMIIDPGSLADIANQPYCSQNVQNATENAENGFDLFEDGGFFYVFSNGYETRDSFFYGTNPGYNPIPKQWGVTCLDPNSLMPASGQAFYRDQSINNAWGVNLVRGNNSGTVILSGYQNNRTSNSYPLTDDNNINPFLAELAPVNLGSSTVMNYYSWNTYLSHVGTGTYGTQHDYSYRGYNYSNIAWGPRTTIRNASVTSDIMMTAPVFNWGLVPPGIDLLATKFVRTYFDGTTTCSFDPGATNGSSEPADITGTPTSQPIISGNVYYAQAFGEKWIQDDFRPDRILDCNNDGFYRKANMTTVQNANVEAKVAVTLYPNPAIDYVQVKLDGIADDAAILVEMTSITGQKVATLYKGIVGNMNSKLKLPELASGSYMVTVFNGSKRLSVQPLTVR
ncbi:T9SS type A sorting domain-containing protein [Taibaiella soli]|uniref:Secretion system C-terminal sorting domain-containing protein n=1 Tax=Taibaiella soli TaxID=1649169 RepID=A0A2W2B7N8_9BACT|nr:T9SS type A sorting domain-containing protein [Taibaiella soli]PZF72279.1 hypothetical protein DN068_13025 [Taibaiella soli]